MDPCWDTQTGPFYMVETRVQKRTRAVKPYTHAATPEQEFRHWASWHPFWVPNQSFRCLREYEDPEDEQTATQGQEPGAPKHPFDV